MSTARDPPSALPSLLSAAALGRRAGVYLHLHLHDLAKEDVVKRLGHEVEIRKG